MTGVIYVVDTPELLAKVSREASISNKLHFVTFQELQEKKLDAQLKAIGGLTTLEELLSGTGRALATV